MTLLLVVNGPLRCLIIRLEYGVWIEEARTQCETVLSAQNSIVHPFHSPSVHSDLCFVVGS